MKAIVLQNYGVPGVFQEQDIAEPELKETQVLVEMYATSIPPGDYPLRSGAMRFMRPIQFPYLLGSDVAGVVKEVGEKVTYVKPGDSVMGLSATNGTYAEYVAMEEDVLALIPPTLSFQEAGALPVVALTAWQALFRYGQLQPDQRILIHAAAGGVGHIAVQLAKQQGAYVIATARTPNHEFVRQLGADEVIDYNVTDFTEAIRTPVDVVLDMVMNRTADLIDLKLQETGRRSYTVLKDGGRFISLVAMTIDEYPKIRGIEAIFFLTQPNREDLEAIIRSVQEQKLKVYVHSIFPFTAQGIIEAYRQSEIDPKRGKIVIQRKLG